MSITPCQEPTPSAISPPPFLGLPLELQYLVISNLSYPDALALKHTHPHFYNLVKTSVSLKVAWLLERKERNLEWPQKKCAMKTDAAFCGGNSEVRAIMLKRRVHAECAGGDGGCEVVVGSTCGGAKAMWRRRVRPRSWVIGVERPGRLLLVWVVGLFVMSLAANAVSMLKWRFSQR